MEREEQESRRESGMPGGGQGRKDEVGKTHVYPLSGDEMPSGDELVRTPGEFGQRGRGLEGYYDHGDSEALDLPPDNQDNKTGFGGETAASGTVDPDADIKKPEKY